MIQSWQQIKSEQRGEYRVFKIREDLSRSPRTGKEHSFYVIEADDWVNVIPVTPEGQMVFIRQYRHGTRDITLEVPGGTVDGNESAEGAARRELREETGFDAARMIYLGFVEPNPAIQNNVCHSYLALGARPYGDQNLDGTEEIDVVMIDPADVPSLIVGGQIRHALVVTAFYLFDQYGKQREAKTAEDV